LPWCLPIFGEFRGNAGILSFIEIDTAHFKGNFPESCEVHATYSPSVTADGLTDSDWTEVLPRTKLGPHRQHQFQLANVEQPYTHIKVTIHPDGGVKRIRVIGWRAHQGSDAEVAIKDSRALTTAPSDVPHGHQSETSQLGGTNSARIIPALALTAEAFAPFGQVVQAYADVNAVPSPRTTRITGANQGTAAKFHKLALLESSYPPAANATTGLSVYRCRPVELSADGLWEVRLLERHPATKQAFIPMGEASGSDALEKPGKRYLVIVALNGSGDRPDLDTMRAFVASAGQGIMYNTAVWRELLPRLIASVFLPTP
jgi:allantoicase